MPEESVNTRYRRRKSVRVAIVSDTHGYVDARVLDVAGTCDVVVHAGDIGNAKVLQALASVTDEVLAVRGNNDTRIKWPVRDKSVLATLPDALRVALPGGYLAVVHGHRDGVGGARHQRLRRLYGDVRVIAYGHSHRLLCDCDSTPWILNPGAGGRSRTFGGPSCLILFAAATQWKVQPVRFPLRQARVSQDRQTLGGSNRDLPSHRGRSIIS